MAIPVEKILDALGINDEAQAKFIEYGRVFDEADTDRSHTLDKRELLTVLKKVKSSLPAGQTPERFAEAVISYCNSDSDTSTLTKEEYFKGLIGYDVKETWQDMFMQADKDHSGKLNEEELDKLLEETNCSKYMLCQIRRFIKTHDLNDDGELDYKEFIENFILSGGHMEQKK